MPRIPYRNAEDAETAELGAAVRARRAEGKLINLDRMLLHSPPYARGVERAVGRGSP